MFTRFARVASRAVPIAGSLSLSLGSRNSRRINLSQWGLVSGVGAVVLTIGATAAAEAREYAQLRQDIAKLLEDNEDMGPTLVRLAWHSSGTFSQHECNGGSEGARMRFSSEGSWGANAGLDKARTLLEPLKQKYPSISYSDLWTLAGVEAIQFMGGPEIPWRSGRVDFDESSPSLPDGRLPDAKQGPSHLRAIFYRMGFSDQEIVALSGAHALGRCHRANSGFEGPWTRAPTTFSNEYFRELVENQWKVKDWDGNKQFEDPTGELMMLPTDMCLLEDDSFRAWVHAYARDEELFFQDFTKAFVKLTELGVKSFSKSGWFFE